VSRLIGGFKGGREVRAARLFAELFSHERLGLGDCQPAGFVLPPRSKRQEDHAWALAMEFSRLWKKPILDILTENQGEKGSHRIQKQLTGDQRHERRYRAKDGFELADWSQRGSLILVDDVITSGATAMAAYMALEDPSRFEVWTLVNRPKLAGTGAF
jgi:predicted amidophosphoribosyltransferase